MLLLVRWLHELNLQTGASTESGYSREVADIGLLGEQASNVCKLSHAQCLRHTQRMTIPCSDTIKSSPCLKVLEVNDCAGAVPDRAH